MQPLVLATSNTHKVMELQGLLADLPIKIHPQSEFSVPTAAETGLSFAENALLKARQATRFTTLPALADDSGLVVDALQGAPGIYSARYAGVEADDAANRQKLLAAMQDIPAGQRQASFHCVLVYLRHTEDPAPAICHGVWHGNIALTERGQHGFGYDPVFIPQGYECTAAELQPAQKQQLSHRALALKQLRDVLIQEF